MAAKRLQEICSTEMQQRLKKVKKIFSKCKIIAFVGSYPVLKKALVFHLGLHKV